MESSYWVYDQNLPEKTKCFRKLRTECIKFLESALCEVTKGHWDLTHLITSNVQVLAPPFCFSPLQNRAMVLAVS